MISLTLALLVAVEPPAVSSAPSRASSATGPARSFRLVEPRAAFVAPLFQAPSGVRAAGKPLKPLSQAQNAEPEMTCTLRVLKADPNLDRAIARDAPKDLDPEMAVRSRCAEPEQK